MKKNKILKVFSIIIAISLIVLITIGIVFVEAYSKINGKKFTDPGGTYHNAFQTKEGYRTKPGGPYYSIHSPHTNITESEFYNLTWDNVKNKYYTAGVSSGYSDYEVYIEGSPDGYCLNDDTADNPIEGMYGDSNFYVAAIIDIEGGNVKVTNKNSNSIYVGNEAAQVAEAVYYKYNRPYEKDFNSSENAWYVENWMNTYGWNKLYSKIKTYINDSTVESNLTQNSNHKNAFSTVNYDLSGLNIVKGAVSLFENGTYSVGGKTCETKIGTYTISRNTSLNYTITVVDEDNKQYTGIYNDSDDCIYTEAKITKKIKAIKITQSYEGYKARLIVLGTGASQARMIACAKKATISKTAQTTDIPVPNTNISLQKYIVGVSSTAGNAGTDTLGTARRNKYAVSADSTLYQDADSFNHRDHNISKFTNETTVSTTNISGYNKSIKREAPVKIEAGDKVTYRITVYNNSNVDASEVKVYDDGYPSQGTITEMKAKRGGGSYSSATTLSTAGVTATDTTSGKKAFTFALAKNTKMDIYVTIRYEQYSDSLVRNRAFIYETTPTNKKDNRTIDGDYIEMEKYQVSLEKFVSSINGNNLSYNENYDINNDGIVDAMDSRTILKYSDGNIELDANQIKKADINGDGKVNAQDARKLLQSLEREEHPTYVDTDKENAPVHLEVGDEVTYTIKLENTGDTIIKVTEIEDTFDDNNNANIIYVDGSISGYGNNFNVEQEDGKLKITLQNPEEIPAGEFRYLTLKFKVEVPVENTDVEQLLKNTAEVKTIINRNDVTVLDSDGETNNIDSDWVKTKTYAVSLEKYVSKVENTDGSIEDYSNRANLEEHSDDATNTSNLDNVTATVTKDTKYNTPVIVSNGDKVTYTIKVTNDGNTNVKITNVADYLPNGVNDITGDVYCTGFGDGNGQTGNENNYSNIIELSPKETKSFEITVTVTEPNISMKILKNVAEITSMKNKNDKDVLDTTGKNNKDADYIQLDYVPEDETTSYTVQKDWVEGSTPENVTVRLYKVKADGVEEYITGKEVVLSSANNWTHTWQDLDKDLTYIARELSKDGKIVKDTTKYSDNITTEYTAIDSGIIITNYNTTPPGKISYTVVKVWDDNNNPNRPTSITVRLFKNSEKVEDIELNNSNWSYTWIDLDEYDEEGNLIQYTAKELKNGSWGSKVVVEEGEKYNDDYTAHYLQEQNKTTITNKMENPPEEEDDDNLAIAGIVWNDLALDKTQNRYDGLKDEQEEVLAGVKVMLHRVYVNKSGNEQYIGEVASTYTNENGEYSFTNESLSTSKVPLKDHEKFIKGPRVEGTKRWDGTYYYYYVVFEYDGVTYTSTTITDNNATHVLGIKNGVYNDSNAREKLDNESYEGKVEESRTEFNKGFSTIDNSKDIDYTTINESGYIPQSIHQYNSEMAIQSSTKLIRLTSSEELEEQLKHINLGLRGRDTFDLELTSDVYSTKVTVNGVSGDYTYNSNKVTVRRTDANNYNYEEDTANPHLDGSKYDGQDYNQSIRQTDINVNTTMTEGYKTAYGDTGLGIEVTYKITVTNASNSAGAATKITNYYDSKYKFEKAYAASGELATSAGSSGTGYKSRVITTPGTRLNKTGDKMEIYVVYTYDLTNTEAKNALFDLNIGDKLPTYNMAEITAYKTFATGNNEATRGLIDKDSAPGSANSEKVRLHPDQIGSETTVKYYFGGNDLSILKYEDDTYATPTLYFAKDNSKRKIEGIVFEDKTGVDKDSNIKTGSGVYEEGEAKVFGATVELVEINTGDEPNKIAENSGTVRYRTNTRKDGSFEFEGYLPGNYVIRYWYGNSKETVLLKQADDGSVNNKSYNGEDFHATNNKYPMIITDKNGNTITAKALNSSSNDWYAFNEDERISTGFDNSDRRITVSQNLTKEDTEENIAKTIEVQKQLNKARNGESINVGSKDETGSLIEQTYMYATTPTMLLTVEETVKVNDSETKQNTQFGDYKISEMNFGIAEVPVTTIDLQKQVKAFSVTDSTGQNVIASLRKDENGNWKLDEREGNIIPLDEEVSVSIEDEKLQGARLQVTYEITSNMNIELNYDNTSGVKSTITELADIVDNNLSYNKDLICSDGNKNEYYWNVDTIDKSSIEGISNYSTILKATDAAKTELNAERPIYITLEKILSSTDSTIEEIITSSVEIYNYNNTVEITGLSYENYLPDGAPSPTPGSTTPVLKDRIRTSDRYIIIPGVHHDSASAEEIIIHPPTGDSSISMVYYVIAVIGLTVLAVGVFGIKKFVVKK